MSNETKPLLSDEHVQETLIAISTYEGEGGRRFFLNGWNGDAQKHWSDAVKWTKSFYDEDRSKLMAVLQVCADALNTTGVHLEDDGHLHQHYDNGKTIDALSQLKSIGVEPNHPAHPAGDN